MILARWNIVARFGHKQETLGLLKAWNAEIAPQIGWTADKVRVLVGSIGANESLIQSEVVLDSISELDASFAKLAKVREHADWSKKLEPHVVSGTNQWEIYRIQ